MHTSTATLERPRPHPVCACPPNAMHSAWDIVPCAVGPHGPACPLWDTAGVADSTGQDAADTSPDLWLG